MIKKTPGSRFALAALAGVVVLALVPAAIAGKGGKPGGPTGSSTVTVSPDGPYSFGQQIWITTDAPIYPNNAGPYIWLKCYQSGVLVGSWDHAGFSGGWYYNWPFTLGPTQSWSGGAADCTVKVVHKSKNRVITDATTSFHVGA